ncbi:hypothetical protein PFISCL1PPCAC_23389, partial [Pristionchus fissidentatus]
YFGKNQFVKLFCATALTILSVGSRIDSIHSAMSPPPPLGLVPVDNATRSDLFTLFADFDGLPTVERFLFVSLVPLLISLSQSAKLIEPWECGTGGISHMASEFF